MFSFVRCLPKRSTYFTLCNGHRSEQHITSDTMRFVFHYFLSWYTWEISMDIITTRHYVYCKDRWTNRHIWLIAQRYVALWRTVEWKFYAHNIDLSSVIVNTKKKPFFLEILFSDPSRYCLANTHMNRNLNLIFGEISLYIDIENDGSDCTYLTVSF